ncbi:MAG: YdeI/OmpD-associated family protein [Anaerolineae bacterium]|nr:YdeI/OmpD-associated family protein [Anaerolineae bacterium]
MDITETLYVSDRAGWRRWLMDNHATATEIWLITYSKTTGKSSVPYLHAVEEALCFGWIDGIAKKMDAERTAQRFTPRRPKSNWTELNKERARRLIAAGLMTDAGRAKLPDLSLDAFQIAPDILEALQADPQVWANFQAFPGLYQRIRVSAIEEVRRQPEEFKRRLNKFLDQTRQNKMFGGME